MNEVRAEVTVPIDPERAFLLFTGGSSTRVRLRHAGFESVRSEIGYDVGYETGWAELLSWYRSTATASLEERTCT